ncbi:hypothetical protein DS646_23345, partial [Salmonella enterica subsp. enterica serovar Schwarzengrund]|nr:hypothetical protein [Salmonella enterica subsp. enterica serovar Schwarzengrund]
ISCSDARRAGNKVACRMGEETPYPASVIHLYRELNSIKKPRRGGVFLQLPGDYARTKSM